MRFLIGFISLFILTGCLNNSAVDQQNFKTIMIKSAGEIETLPDMATFHISLTCLDKSVKASKNCLVDKSNELNDLLQSFGISEEHILTTSVNMNKSFTWRNNSRVFEGYRSSTTIFVTIIAIDNLDKIYSELLENQNIDLGGLSYSHSRLDSLKNEAYVNALEKSGKLADRLLDNLPESEKEILKIGNIEISASLPEGQVSRHESSAYAVEEAKDSQSSAIAIGKGTVRVNATLFVEYQIN